jgi:hypothetical protein
MLYATFITKKRFTSGRFWHRISAARHRISSGPIEEELGGGGVGLRHDVVHLAALAASEKAMGFMAPTTAWRGHWAWRDMKI